MEAKSRTTERIALVLLWVFTSCAHHNNDNNITAQENSNIDSIAQAVTVSFCSDFRKHNASRRFVLKIDSLLTIPGIYLAKNDTFCVLNVEHQFADELEHIVDRKLPDSYQNCGTVPFIVVKGADISVYSLEEWRLHDPGIILSDLHEFLFSSGIIYAQGRETYMYVCRSLTGADVDKVTIGKLLNYLTR